MISLCMIVKNEERVLARCLHSAASLAGEIIVVDTGSTDATLEIAARYGAKVISFDFTRPDFAAARNQALAHASGRWILTLDADETLEPESVPLIRDLATRNENVRNENTGYYFERVNHDANLEK